MDPSPPRKTLLLVEDEALIALAEAQALEKEGYEVLCAYSGEKALALFRSADPPVDLVLMDINLGRGPDGGQVAESLLLLREVPVVFLSAYCDAETLGRIRHITPFGYVPKNAGIPVLAAAIETALRLEEALRRRQEADRFHHTVLIQAWEGIAAYDRELRHVVWNRFLEEITGLSASQVLGRTAAEVFGPETAGSLEKNLRRALSGETVVHHEELLPFSPTSRWVAASYAPLLTSEETVEGVIVTITDLTRQKNVEAALVEAEEHYRVLFEKGSDAVTICDLAGVLLEANDLFCERYGPDKDEIARQSVRISDIDPGATPEVLRERARALQSQGTLSFETLHRDREGTLVPVEENTRLISYRGTPAILSFHRDISAHKATEAKLRELRQTSRALLDATQDLMILLDRNGLVLEANLALAREMGMDREAVLHRNIFDLIPPDTAARQRALFLALRDAGVPHRHEELFDDVLLDLRIFPLKEGPETPERFAVSCRNITEARQQEESLRRSEARHRTLFQESPVPMVLFDPATGAVTEANAAAATFYGYPLEELRRLSVETTTSLSREIFRENVERALRGERVHVLSSHRLASGERCPAESFWSVLEGVDRPLLLATVLHRRGGREAAEAPEPGEPLSP